MSSCVPSILTLMTRRSPESLVKNSTQHLLFIAIDLTVRDINNLYSTQNCMKIQTFKYTSNYISPCSVCLFAQPIQTWWFEMMRCRFWILFDVDAHSKLILIFTQQYCERENIQQFVHLVTSMSSCIQSTPCWKDPNVTSAERVKSKLKKLMSYCLKINL